ncbi:coilin [Pezoporus flaviventris]|uniref:coilin n=1 Tax=Pezoporus flaviventris TaxID=889875 RepID=UPI002AB0C3FA|nr:coilin [Pezoporus flaviventris]
MAAAGGGPVRLRLVFDYPPPGSPGCALCWLLLEPGRVRLVTDLISLIRHRFGFSRRARLSLFLEGALLPPTESARLVRDNDSLRVKLEEIAAAEYEEIGDGFFYTPTEDKKRHRQKKEEEDFSLNEKHRHKKKKHKHSSEYPSCREEASVDIWDSHKKHKKRKRKDGASERNRLTEGNEESSSGQSKKLKKTGREKELAAKKKDGKQTKATAAKVDSELANQSSSRNYGKNNTKKPIQSKKRRVGASPPSSTSSDSDSSETSIQQNKSSRKPIVSALPKDKSQAAASADVKTVVANKVTVKPSAANSPKTAVSKNAKKSASSSSDSDSSAEDEKVAAAHSSMAKEKPLPSTTKAPKAQASSSQSESSGSETLVKKSAADAGLSNSIARNCSKTLPNSIQGPLASPGRGRGYGTGEDNFRRGPRGRGYRGVMRGQGPGRGANPGFFYNYNSEGQKQRQLNEAATNSSVLVQNPVEVPKRDYSVLPLLAAPPQVGQRIAFKRLELTENYCPEVSDYKEGKIISWHADKKQIELEILSPSAGQHAKEPGKFDLVYQSADGAELIEYAIPQDTKITERWDALIEPRLIVEPPVNGSSIENGTI